MVLRLGPDSEKQDLWAKVLRLRRKLKRKKEELEEYKKRHPETVGVKHGKAYEIKPSPRPALDSPKEKRKPGGQPGHTGHHRRKPERVDQRKHIRIKKCPDCHGRVSRIQETRSRIVEDIPQVESVVTEFLIDRRYCKNCRCLVEASIEDALPGARIGLRAMLAVAWLRYTCRVPQEIVPKLMLSLFGLRLSTGEVQGILDQLAKAYGGVYDKLVSDLRSRDAVNVDETSWRLNGDNQWLWTFVTRWETVYHVAEGRNHEVPLEIMGGEYTGTIGSDRHSAYATLARKTGAKQQYCWWHILGDAKELAEHYPEEGAPMLESLKSIYANALEVAPNGCDEDVEVLQDSMLLALHRPCKSNHCARFARNVLKASPHLFTFVTDPEVDSTNNRAERALRPVVMGRKISGGSRSGNATRVRGVLSSLLRTMDQQGLDLLEETPKALLTSHG